MKEILKTVFKYCPYCQKEELVNFVREVTEFKSGITKAQRVDFYFECIQTGQILGDLESRIVAKELNNES